MRGIQFYRGEIGYRLIPKTACTSIQHAIYRFEAGCDYRVEENENKYIDAYYWERQQDIDGCNHRILVIREPIKRFLSAYGNRVTHHKQLSEEKVRRSNPDIAEKISIFNPGLGQFFDDFELYMDVNPIWHHTRKVEDIIGGRLDLFNHIIPLEKINLLSKLVEGVSGQKFTLGRHQTGGRKYLLQDLSRHQLEMLIEFYRPDYHMLNDYYTIDAIWTEWKLGISR